MLEASNFSHDVLVTVATAPDSSHDRSIAAESPRSPISWLISSGTVAPSDGRRRRIAGVSGVPDQVAFRVDHQQTVIRGDQPGHDGVHEFAACA